MSGIWTCFITTISYLTRSLQHKSPTEALFSNFKSVGLFVIASVGGHRAWVPRFGVLMGW